MSYRMIEKFKNFTCQGNSGFKVAFTNGYIVSVAWTDHNGDESFENGEIVEPFKMPAFTFNMEDLAIFKDGCNGFVTGDFCENMDDINYDPYQDIVIYVTPEQVAKIMAKVAAYKN